VPIIACILSARYQTKSRHRRRQFLLLHSPTGINPLPFRLWLAFPEMGVLTCYQEGMVRGFLLKHLTPRFPDDLVISELFNAWSEDFGMIGETWPQRTTPPGKEKEVNPMNRE